MDFATLTDVQLIELPLHAHDNGQLVVVEQGKAISFLSARVFTVCAPEGAIRGRHAHKRCSQFLVCVHGAIEVECDDGTRKSKFLLDAGNKALLVPPSIWATEVYLVGGSVLTVLCDRHYEVADYIRDYDQFLGWRKAGVRALDE